MSFGDADPEDAWDPDDAVVELVANLGRRITAILAMRAATDVVTARLNWLLADLEHVGRRVQTGQIGSRHG
jgi:hypothetical protein